VSGALAGIRVCDFTGQLAGAGATRFLAAMGAQVIRVEDPVKQGRWDILRGTTPYVDDRRGIEFGGAFNNHNIEKLGVTINLRTDEGKQLLRELIAISDVVAENFAAGVLARLGFPYEEQRRIKPDIVYVSNSGFGHRGPYSAYRTWGPIVQAVCGLTFSSGVPDLPAAGWGYSYMDHHGGNFMAIAILAGLLHRRRTGEGQWIDMSCTDAGATLLGPLLLDATVNDRPLRRPGMPHSSHSQSPRMVPHNIYAARGDDEWIAIACRDDREWRALANVVDEPWARDPEYDTLDGRSAKEAVLDAALDQWCSVRDKFETQVLLQDAGVPAAAVQRPEERIEFDPATAAWGLWPMVHHREIGAVRVDGLPVHFSETDWSIAHGAPCLGQHNDFVFGELLGHDAEQIARWREDGVL